MRARTKPANDNDIANDGGGTIEPDDVAILFVFLGMLIGTVGLFIYEIGGADRLMALLRW